MVRKSGVTALVIRKGDSVKLEALPAEAHGGQFSLTLDGEGYRSPNMHPLVFEFPEAGTYVIDGDYRKGNAHTYSSITVEVIGGSFEGDNPACLVGQRRDWTFEDMPSNVVYEVDESVEMSVLGTSPNVTNQSSIVTKLSLTAYNPNGEHVLVARAYPGGPIIDSIRLDTFWIQNAVDGYAWIIGKFDDSELWTLDSIEKYLPDTVDIRIKVIVGGVMLDDYSLERWITNADYDETGTYYFSLFHPNDSHASVCHTFEAYQNGQFIGTDYAYGETDFSEEE